MPIGHLVSLGTSNSLETLDSISGSATSFTTAQVIGAGSWVWSGMAGGTTYQNSQEPGSYQLGTDGNVYFVPDFGPADELDIGNVVNAPSFAINDGLTEGTSGADLIDSGFADPDGSSPGAGADTIRAGDGGDTVQAGDGADLISGEGGSDDLQGGGGNDTIYGDAQTPVAATDENFVWKDVAGDGLDISEFTTEFTRSTGVIDVTVSITDDGDNFPFWTVESTDTVYVAPGEDFDPQSSLRLSGSGTGATSTTRLEFSADDTAYSGAVEGLSFRINDFDFGTNNHRDIVTIEAFLDGVAVPVTITPGGTQTVSGNTVTAGNTSTTESQLAGSVLIEIDGPVDDVSIIYANGLPRTQAIWVSDLSYTAVPALDGDDTIDGGDGADSLFGGGGNDAILVGQGDTASGGDGDDTFTLTDTGEGPANITIIGGEGGEGAGDTLDLNGRVAASAITYTNTDDDAGGLSGTATLRDGSLLTFSEIETIICFAPGTRILTETGPRPVELLAQGDLLVTKDHGLQPVRWRGMSRTRADGALAPIRIAPGDRFGNTRPLLVSPQHRLLEEGWTTQLNHGEAEVLVAAKHLINGRDVTLAPQHWIAYHHIALDRHAIIYAEGVETESFHPGHEGLDTLSPRAIEAFFKAFPGLRGDPEAYGPTARPVLRAFEARALIA